MHIQTCTANDIFELNQKKEYTLTATCILESVITNPHLNAQTVKLWQLLFNKSKFHPNLEIKICYNDLAKILNKSRRSITRYVSTLVREGYLLVSKNIASDGTQRENTLYVRVPSNVVEESKNLKDRVFNISTKKNGHTTQNAYMENTREATPSHIANDNLPSLKSKEAKQIHDKIDVGEDDKIDVQKNNNIKEIINNNPVVYSKNKHVNISSANTSQPSLDECTIILPTQNKILSLRQNEQELKTIIDEETKILDSIENHMQRYDQIKKINQFSAELTLLHYAIEREFKKIEELNKESRKQKNITSNQEYFLNQAGDRQLSKFTFKRLVKSLQSYGYQGHKLNCLINEIVFEARFGSLVNCNKTKKPLSIDNAINIGLKLVRGERWSTPTLLKNLGEIG